MSRTIVVCCDGTGNTFDRQTTNVTELIRDLAMDDHERQVTVYAQGVGTNGARQTELMAFAQAVSDREALHLIPAPRESSVAKLAGLTIGYGIKESVQGMYEALAELHRDPGDRIFLFGFSRGAFAVRALAGLIYRCGLPERGSPSSQFDRVWDLYTPMRGGRAITDGRRECKIYFLGIWDTVKSYGGLRPIMLPHLRHNPIVHYVRHALALHEKRAWFKATTWGQLDNDRTNAMTRVHAPAEYDDQDIREVWFTGCHSDVGAGEIALRWMVAEALRTGPGLRFSAAGRDRLRKPEPTPEINESSSFLWWLSAMIPRLEIFNDGVWPRRRPSWGSNGARQPQVVLRNRRFSVHSSAADSIETAPCAAGGTTHP